MTTLSFEFDPKLDVITIEGIRYAGSLFRGFATARIGEAFRVVARSNDGVLVLERIRCRHRCCGFWWCW
jgi:hypothetical protein